jgi:hypothetical protein
VDVHEPGGVEAVDGVGDVDRVAADAGDLALELRPRPQPVVARQQHHHHDALELRCGVDERGIATFCMHGRLVRSQPVVATLQGVYVEMEVVNGQEAQGVFGC